MRVLIAGGGTAGHVEPALNLAEELRARQPSAHIVMLGTERGLETDLVPPRGFPLELITPVPLPRRPNGDLVALPFRMHGAVYATRDIIRTQRLEAVVGFGGYVSTPAYLAARNRVPMVVHEGNAKAGLANRLGARMTAYVAEAVAGSLPHARRIGMPLRASIATLDRTATRAEARQQLGLDPDKPCLLVFGGSQGARSINAAVVSALPDLLGAGVQVLHIVGNANADQSAAVADEGFSGYKKLEYLDGMTSAYAAADVSLNRAGAMTCAELAAVGMPAIYVPYAVGNGEQRLNAAPVVAAGGGIVIPDAELSKAAILAACLPLLTDPAKREKMGEAATHYGMRDAAGLLADFVQEAVTHGPRTAKGGRQ